MAENIAALELYRRSNLGICLMETIDELVTEGKISPELAMTILQRFDASINRALATRINNKLTFKGRLHTYRYCDSVWTLILENPTFKLEDSEVITADKVKIVACDGDL